MHHLDAQGVQFFGMTGNWQNERSQQAGQRRRDGSGPGCDPAGMRRMEEGCNRVLEREVRGAAQAGERMRRMRR